MKTTTRLLPRGQLLPALMIGWLVSAASLTAQTVGTGSIQGRVYNPASKEYVQNAEVRLDAILFT